MEQVHNFREIADYFRTVNLNFDNRSPHFFIYDYETANWNHYSPLSTYRQGYFEITFDVTKGCNISIDQFECPPVTSRLTLVSPDRLQTVKGEVEMKGCYKGYSLFFKRDFIEGDSTNSNFLKDFPFFSHLSSPFVTLGGRNDVSTIVEIIQRIKHEHDSGGVLSKQIIRHYLNILFLKAKQNYSDTENEVRTINREQEIYDEFNWLVHLYSSELKSVRAYADKMHITPKHLSETVKKVSGESALDVIHKTQLNRAKVLLCQTRKTVSEIAYELNFSNPEYFSVFFKRLSGVSPSDYRAS